MPPKAARSATDPAVPPVAAVCVYPDPVAVVPPRLAGSAVTTVAVATAFPSGLR